MMDSITMKDKKGKSVGSPLTLEPQEVEEKYLRMVSEATNKHLMLVGRFSEALRKAFKVQPSLSDEFLINNFQTTIDMYLQLAEQLNEWAQNNKALYHFPANSDDLENAKTLASKAYAHSKTIASCYLNAIESTTYFNGCAQQEKALVSIKNASDECLLLLIMGRKSISRKTNEINYLMLHDFLEGKASFNFLH